MIARLWRGYATVAKADDYQRHFTTNVAPHLQNIPGGRGAYLLKRRTDAQVEFLAITLWESLQSIEGFAGADPTVAIVEPEGRAALSSFDDFASHFEVAFKAVPIS
jgi:heme-degrading monooxygenase HmoA